LLLISVFQNLIDLLFLFGDFFLDRFGGFVVLIFDGFVDPTAILSQLMAELFDESDRIFVISCIFVFFSGDGFLFFGVELSNSFFDIGLIFFIDRFIIDIFLFLLHFMHKHLGSF
jgi:hypothetical protein